MTSFSLSALSALLLDAPLVRSKVVARDPAPDSMAEWDLAACKKDIGTAAPVERVILCADLWTSIAANQLMGIGVLLYRRDTLFATFPILRSVIEHGAATTWVMDDKIDSRERAKRAALAALRSEEEMVKVSAKLGGRGTDTNKAAKAQFRALREAIKVEFGDLVESGGWSIDGVSLPKPTEMIEHFGGRWGDARQWSGMYDYFCATANHPSLSAFEYATLDGSGSSGFTASLDMVQRLVRAALVPYLKSMEYLCAYMGWDRSALDTYIDRINEVLGGVLSDPTD